LEKVGDSHVSMNTIQHVVGDVRCQLAERRDADPKTAEALAERPEKPSELGVVECDGGRVARASPGTVGACTCRARVGEKRRTPA
jgi:hypothetical protein